jgi:hypothetical protein
MVTGYFSLISLNLRLLLLIVLLPCSGVKMEAQKETGNVPVSRTMRRIPDSLTWSTDDLAGYINANFTTRREKSRAAFLWITRNIKYNFDSIITNSIYETPSEVSERILKTRTGVCLNFAHLFSEISNKVGARCYIVQGYTKQNGRVDYLPHLWCASFIDTAWYLFDPTWGSAYFMTKPAVMIRSHMPFDPIWQLLYHPITHQEFYKSNFWSAKNRPFFNYPDTLQAYERASELERTIASARRIEQSGVKNTFTEAKLRVLHGNIDYLRNKQAAEKYDTAAIQYNKGITMLNRFITSRNDQFRSDAGGLQSKQILDSSGYYLASALKVIAAINAPDENINVSANQLKNAIYETMKVMEEQRTYFYNFLKNRR